MRRALPFTSRGRRDTGEAVDLAVQVAPSSRSSSSWGVHRSSLLWRGCSRVRVRAGRPARGCRDFRCRRRCRGLRPSRPRSAARRSAGRRRRAPSAAASGRVPERAARALVVLVATGGSRDGVAGELALLPGAPPQRVVLVDHDPAHVGVHRAAVVHLVPRGTAPRATSAPGPRPVPVPGQQVRRAQQGWPDAHACTPRTPRRGPASGRPRSPPLSRVSPSFPSVRPGPRRGARWKVAFCVAVRLPVADRADLGDGTVPREGRALGAVGMLLLLVVAVAILWWRVTAPADDGDVPRGPSAPVDTGQLWGLEPPDDLGEDEAWFAELELDAWTLVAADAERSATFALWVRTWSRAPRAWCRPGRRGGDRALRGRHGRAGRRAELSAASDGQATAVRVVEVQGRELVVAATGTVEAVEGRLVLEADSIVRGWARRHVRRAGRRRTPARRLRVRHRGTARGTGADGRRRPG